MGCKGLMSHPRTDSSLRKEAGGAYAHDARFNVSNAAAASRAVLIRNGLSFTVGEYQNGLEGATVGGRSSRGTASDVTERPSISRFSRSNRCQPASSGLFDCDCAIPLIVSSHRVPIFRADFTAAPN